MLAEYWILVEVSLYLLSNLWIMVERYPSANQVLAFWSDKPVALLGQCPMMYRPPEVCAYNMSEGKVGCVWSQAADVWAVACLVRTTTERNQYHVSYSNGLRWLSSSPRLRQAPCSFDISVMYAII